MRDLALIAGKCISTCTLSCVDGGISFTSSAMHACAVGKKHSAEKRHSVSGTRGRGGKNNDT